MSKKTDEKKRPRFGRLPERAVTDKRLWRTRHGMHMRVLLACAIHANAAGIFCISQETAAKLVGLKHGANAHSYLKDLTDWGYLQRVTTIAHPDRKFIKEAARALGRTDIKPPYLSDLIIRQIIIRPGEDGADAAAKIPASKRIDEDHPIIMPEMDPPPKPEPPLPPAPNYGPRTLVAQKVDRPKPLSRPSVGGVASQDFNIF